MASDRILGELIRTRFGAKASATLCEVRASTRSELLSMVGALANAELARDRRRKIQLDHAGQVILRLKRWHDVLVTDMDYPMLFKVSHMVDGTFKPSRNRHYGLIGTVLTLSERNRPTCDVVAINMSAAKPAARMILNLDLSRFLELTPRARSSYRLPQRPSYQSPQSSNTADGEGTSRGRRRRADEAHMPLVVLHGPDRCNAAENYSAISWKRIPEQCWHDARARLMEHRTIFAASCLPAVGTLWCVATVNTSTACTRRPPLLLQPVASSDEQQAGAQAAKPTAKAGGDEGSCQHAMQYERVRFASRRVSWQVSEKYRYYTLLPCAGNASVGDSVSGTSGISNTGALCLIFKNAITEVWVGGVRSLDGGRSFGGETELVMPAYNPLARLSGQDWGLPRGATMTHNYATIRLRNGTYVFLGGRHRHPLRFFNGIWIARGRSWRWNDSVSTNLQVSPSTHVRGASEFLASQPSPHACSGHHICSRAATTPLLPTTDARLAWVHAACVPRPRSV